MINLDALKAAGLNSRENSERLLAQHRAQQSVDPEGIERRCDCFWGGVCHMPDPCPLGNKGIVRVCARPTCRPGGG